MTMVRGSKQSNAAESAAASSGELGCPRDREGKPDAFPSGEYIESRDQRGRKTGW